MSEHAPTAPAVQAALLAPFPADVVSWKPQSVKGNRALATAYIDARDVMDRLDSVVGIGGWTDSYKLLPDGNVACTLAVTVGGEWVSKEDVGGPSDQPDGGDRMKSAYSDALKRAAVKFGVGRFLYSLPSQWCDYDPVKKTFLSKPTLPGFTPPKPQPVVQPKPQPQPVQNQGPGHTVGDLIRLLKLLAKLREVDESGLYTTFLKNFAPDIATASEMPPEMLSRACVAVQVKINRERTANPVTR